MYKVLDWSLVLFKVYSFLNNLVWVYSKVMDVLGGLYDSEYIIMGI